MSISVHQLIVGPLQENTYFFHEEEKRETVVVDPGDDASVIIETLMKMELVPIAIINTHAHLDHIGAVQSIMTHFNIPWYLHENEKDILAFYEQQCLIFGIKPSPKPVVSHWINSEEPIEIGEIQIQVVETPGHTPGGVCYHIDNYLFTGDTLFNGSVGRTDLPSGNWSQLEKSLTKIIHSFPNNTIICSGHGNQTTLGNEIISNPFLIPLNQKNETVI